MGTTETAPDLGKRRIGLYLRESKLKRGRTIPVETQEEEGNEWADGNNAKVVATYKDEDISASKYGTKKRRDWERLLADLRAGRLDLLWLWDLSRLQRTVDDWTLIRKLILERGVLLVVDGEVYDISNPTHMHALTGRSNDDEFYSAKLSKNVKRGIRGQIREKRPPGGRVLFGFAREYDPETREFIRQYIHPERGPIAKEIIRQLSRSVGPSTIEKQLKEHGITKANGKFISRYEIREMGLNKGYLGIRVHQPTKVVEVDGKKKRVPDGEAKEYPDSWPSLFEGEEDVFWRAYNLLTDTARPGTRPARAEHLLSWIAVCDDCGEFLAAQHRTENGKRNRSYECPKRHVRIKADAMDAYVKAVVDAYLDRVDVQEFIAAGMADELEIVAARAEIYNITAEIEKNRELWKAGRLDGDDWADYKDAANARLVDAKARAEAAGLPAILREGRPAWSDLERARPFLRELAEIRLGRAPRGRGTPIEDRVTITPRIGKAA